MTERERVMSVYAGEIPDKTPLLLDLSHWYKKNMSKPFDLAGYHAVEQGLVELHRQARAVCYVEMGSFYRLDSGDPEVVVRQETRDGVFSTTISTPVGTLHEERVFNHDSYSYAIRRFLLDSVSDFPAVEFVMDRLRAQPNWGYYHAWDEALGEWSFPYVQLPYSGSGYLIARYFGVEKTIYAAVDHPEAVARLIERINACNLRILDAVIDGPFQTLFISDNYDSNVQPKDFFDRYVRDYYSEVARRVHQKGKYLAVHVDGEARGILSWLAECGVDCADAVTPSPMFSLTPEQMRREAGDRLILSGGIPATIFAPSASDEEFKACVYRWLETRKLSPRLIMAAGDQVPPETRWERVLWLRELVDEWDC